MIQSLSALRQQFAAENKSDHEFTADDPRRLRPLSLEQQKKRAKDLLKRLRHSQDWERLLAWHPKARTLTAQTVKLSDAQWIVAHELGFRSWPRMKQHIEAAALAKQALRSGWPAALDGDKKTLHIRCGNDVMVKLAIAGFAGDFLSFADPYIQGPVPGNVDRDAFIRVRADFIAGNNWREKDQAYAELKSDYDALAKARDYQRIAFWFEHDAYDVLIFIKLLHFFSEPVHRAPEMHFLCADHYPGVERFNGIGQLPVETMHLLWDQFRAITEDQFHYGKLCWQAYTDSQPENLHRLISQQNSPLPEIIPGLSRHLQELPWLSDGLSLSERLTLKILDEQGIQNAAQLFYHWYTTVYEPLVFMGDSSYWTVLEHLAQARHPAIAIQKCSDKKIDWQVSLTSFGQQLLAGKAHWMSQNTYDRWFGGVHNQSGAPIWYWDESLKQVIYKSQV